MTPAQLVVVVVLVVSLSLVFLNRLREDVAALLMAISLGLAQLLGLGVLGAANSPDESVKALTGFGTPEVITLIALFIITYCLDKYGVTRWLAERILAVGGKSETRLIGLFALTAALLSLFMNTLAAGALLLPSALDASRRSGIKPSKLLIPIAYGTMLGGAATYLTTANIIVSGLLPLAQPPQEALNFLDFTPTGGLVAIAGLSFLVIFGKHLLPDREPSVVQALPSNDELTTVYQLQERLWEAEVLPHSSLIGEQLKETMLGEQFGISILGARRERRVIPNFAAEYKIQANDVLLLVGREERITPLQQYGLAIHASTSGRVPESRGTVFAEIIIPPRSLVEGKSLRDLAFRATYGFTAVALWRNNRSYRTDVGNFQLAPGDTILLMGSKDQLARLKNQHNFIVVGTGEDGGHIDASKVALTLAISLVALIALFIGVPAELAMLGGALALILFGLIEPEEAYSAIRWRAIFLIAGTISVSIAMIQTGLAQRIGDSIVRFAEPFGPMGLVAGAYLLSAALTQVMGGQISPLVVGPIAISAAIQLGVNPRAIAVVTAIAGSVAFITPLSHPVNILMIAPANYKFIDFVRSGWLLTIVCFIALMIAIPLFWQL